MQTLVILAALAWADSPEVAAYTLSVDSKPSAAAVLKQITETPLADLPAPAPDVSSVVALRKPRPAKASEGAAQAEASGAHECSPENCGPGCPCYEARRESTRDKAKRYIEEHGNPIPVTAPAPQATTQAVGLTPAPYVQPGDLKPRFVQTTPQAGRFLPDHPWPLSAPQQVYYYTTAPSACANGQCGTTYAQPMRRGLFGRWR